MENYSLIETLMLNQGGVISLIGAGGKTTLMFRLAKELAMNGKKVLTTTTTKIFMPSSAQSPELIISNSVEEIIRKSKHALKTQNHITAAKELLPDRKKLKGVTPGMVDRLWESSLFDLIIVEADGARRLALKASASFEPVIPDSTKHVIALAGLTVIGKSLDDETVFRAPLVSEIAGLPMGGIITESCLARVLAHEMEKVGKPLALKTVFLNKADNADAEKTGQRVADKLKGKSNNTINRIVIGSLLAEFPVRQWIDIKESQGFA